MQKAQFPGFDGMNLFLAQTEVDQLEPVFAVGLQFADQA